MKKKMVLITLIICFIFSIVPTYAGNGYFKEIEKYKTMIQIKQPDEISNYLLTHRKDRYILIEIEYGIVTDNAKNGKILNTKNTKYNYISYSNVKGIKKGNKVLTILIYDNTNGEDNIAIRFDKVIKK